MKTKCNCKAYMNKCICIDDVENIKHEQWYELKVNWEKDFDKFNAVVNHSNGKEYSLLNIEETKLVKQFISSLLIKREKEIKDEIFKYIENYKNPQYFNMIYQDDLIKFLNK